MTRRRILLATLRPAESRDGRRRLVGRFGEAGQLVLARGEGDDDWCLYITTVSTARAQPKRSPARPAARAKGARRSSPEAVATQVLRERGLHPDGPVREDSVDDLWIEGAS